MLATDRPTKVPVFVPLCWLDLTDRLDVACFTWLFCLQALCRDARCVAAGGAAEIEMARQVADFGKKQTGLDQYAIARFADALEVVPRTIAENSGLQASEVVARLYAAHSSGQVSGLIIHWIDRPNRQYPAY